MIKLFKTTEDLGDLLETNGDIVLRPSKAVVSQSENGEFFLDLEVSADLIDDLVYGYQIVADYLDDYEIFRVGAVTATRDKLKVKCPHITYDADYMFWYDKMPEGSAPPRQLGDRAVYVDDLNKILDFIYTGVSSEYDGTVCFGRKRRLDLDLTNYPVSEQYVVVPNGCSLTEMVNSLLKTYGGYLYRYHYYYTIVPDRPTNFNTKNVLIAYGKNLKSLSRQQVDSTYATGILGVGESSNLSLSSGGIRAYGDTDAFMARRVKFDQKNVLAENYNTQYQYQTALGNDLDAKANQYLTDNSSMKYNYNVKALVDDISGLWDTVLIRDSKLGIDIEARVISLQYDLLLKTFNEVVFGNYSNSMTGYNSKISDEINGVRRDIPLKSYPIGTIITWTSGLVSSPNDTNSGYEGYWTSLGSNTWQRVI